VKNKQTTELRKVTIDSSGDLQELAERNGYVEPEEFNVEPWTPELADALEESAMEYLKTQGIEVVYQEDIDAADLKDMYREIANEIKNGA
jgi:hypothetical protein